MLLLATVLMCHIVRRVWRRGRRFEKDRQRKQDLCQLCPDGQNGDRPRPRSWWAHCGACRRLEEAICGALLGGRGGDDGRLLAIWQRACTGCSATSRGVFILWPSLTPTLFGRRKRPTRKKKDALFITTFATIKRNNSGNSLSPGELRIVPSTRHGNPHQRLPCFGIPVHSCESSGAPATFSVSVPTIPVSLNPPLLLFSFFSLLLLFQSQFKPDQKKSHS